MDQQAIIAKLHEESEEFRTLEEEHHSLDRALEEMNKRLHLSAEEEMEKKNIQKQKLAKKDRMAELIRLRSEK